MMFGRSTVFQVTGDAILVSIPKKGDLAVVTTGVEYLC